MADEIQEIHFQVVAFDSCFHSVDRSSKDLARYAGNLYPALYWIGCCRTIRWKQIQVKDFLSRQGYGI
ncbi:MAG: hypothetical protein LBD76_08985, partial [Prevotellaceae bacterium]|nr:hypothetical protein [Prevotellaceae bacterium]